MAIEKGIGAGGENVIPMNPEEQIDIVELAAQPGQVNGRWLCPLGRCFRRNDDGRSTS